MKTFPNNAFLWPTFNILIETSPKQKLHNFRSWQKIGINDCDQCYMDLERPYNVFLPCHGVKQFLRVIIFVIKQLFFLHNFFFSTTFFGIKNFF